MFEREELDQSDVQILAALQRNARSTYAELGVAVGLRPPSVHERVKRLESRGFIRGYTARLDPRKLGFGLAAFVGVYTTADVRYDNFAGAVADLSEVIEMHSVAGEESFLLKVLVRSTDHLDDFLSRLKALPGVGRTKTTIVLSTPFERDGIAPGAATAATAEISAARVAGGSR